jgi:hypothetical protein
MKSLKLSLFIVILNASLLTFMMDDMIRSNFHVRSLIILFIPLSLVFYWRVKDFWQRINTK